MELIERQTNELEECTFKPEINRDIGYVYELELKLAIIHKMSQKDTKQLLRESGKVWNKQKKRKRQSKSNITQSFEFLGNLQGKIMKRLEA
jgi:hypothetical protein